MPRQENQKLKITYLIDMFKKETDENHGLTMQQIIERLEEYGIKAERKSIYSDFEVLRDYGLDIEKYNDNGWKYHLVSRDFDLAELKLLVDAVQSSKLITESKTKKLIGKIGSLASRYESSQLKRDVTVINRVKGQNETVLYVVDSLHYAINENHRITFRYFEWTPQKKQELKHSGKLYEVSPWSLIWDDENYYLVGFDSEAGILKHYRVDKIKDVSVLENSKREGSTIFKEQSKTSYSKKFFGMFNGEEKAVTLHCRNKLAGVIIDRFGKGAAIVPGNDGYFDVSVDVVVSSTFFGWVAIFGEDMKITYPESVAQKYADILKRTLDLYK